MRPDGIHIAGMHYKALIVEFDPPSKAKKRLQVLEEAGRIIHWEKAKSKNFPLKKLNDLISKDISVIPSSPDIRVRHIVKNRIHYYIIFNEGQKYLKFKLAVSDQIWHLFSQRGCSRRR